MARVGLTPCGSIFAAGGIERIDGLAFFEAGQRIGHRSESRFRFGTIRHAGQAVEVNEVFGTLMGVFISGGHIIHIADIDIAGSSVENHVVRTAHNAFCLAVLVPVEHHTVPLLVRTGHHVRAKINPPKPFAFQIVALVVVEAGRV